MVDLIIIAILIVTVGGAVIYIYNAKRKGHTCIGCPHSKTCGSKTCNCQSRHEI